MRIFSVLFVFAVYIAASIYFNPSQTDEQLKEEEITQNSKIEIKNTAPTSRTHTSHALIHSFDWHTFGRRYGNFLTVFLIALFFGIVASQLRYVIVTVIAAYVVITCMLVYFSHGTLTIQVCWDVCWNAIKNVFEYLGTMRSLTGIAGFWCGAKCVSDHKLDKKRIVIR